MKKQILYNLEALKAIPLDQRDNEVGICFYARRGIANRWEGRRILIEIFSQWPLYSGNRMYPVPFVDSRFNAIDAFTILPLWEGEYGGLREQLLDFTIKYLKEELENEATNA